MPSKPTLLHINQYGAFRGGAELCVRELAVGMTDVEHHLLFMQDADAGYLEVFASHHECADLHAGAEAVLESVRPDILIIYSLIGQSLAPFLRARDRLGYKMIKVFMDYQMIYAGTGYNRLTLQRSRDPIGWHSLLSCLSRDGFTRKFRFENLWHKKRLLAELKEVDVLEAHTHDMKETLMRNGAPAERIYVNPLWAKPIPSLLDVEKEAHSIIFLGNLIRGKGLQLLLKALPHLKQPYHLKVLGDGYMREGLEATAREQNLNVTFLGHVAKEETGRHLAASQLLVAPSVFEPFGMIMVEAMNHALPVVAFGVAGPTEIVDDGVTGYLVKPFDLKSMAARIDALLADEALRERMGTAGRERLLGRFTFEHHVRLLREQLQHLGAFA